MTRYFTLREALDLLPVMERHLRDAVAAKSHLDETERVLTALHRKVSMLGGVALDPAENIAARRRRDEAAQQLKSELEAMAEVGVQVKDLDIGLIDFPTLYRGREVLLCFRMGEETIRYWHGTDEGFRGRKEIDQDFLDHHEGQGLQ